MQHKLINKNIHQRTSLENIMLKDFQIKKDQNKL